MDQTNSVAEKVLWLISELRAIMKSTFHNKIIMAKRIYDNDTSPISIVGLSRY